MILILKIVNGEEYIGYIEDEETPVHLMEYVTLNDPMQVVDQKDETGFSVMRLNDALLLSDGDYLTFKQNHVITYYKPEKYLREYYEKASVYAKNYSRPRLLNQIKAASKDIESIMREEDSSDPWQNFMNNNNIKPTKH